MYNALLYIFVLLPYIFVYLTTVAFLLLFLLLNCFSLRDSYSLNIQAVDLGSPQQRASTTYTVTVQDENDNSPVFTKTRYRAYLKENSAVGVQVQTVKQ